jgi:hypothetical protein
METKGETAQERRTMKIQNYACICPVCLKKHTIKAEFVSGDVRQDPTGDKYLVVHSCGSHSAKQLQEAYAKR